MLQNLATLYEGSADPVLLIDPNTFSIQWCNKKCATYFGLSCKSITGQTLNKLSGITKKKLSSIDAEVKEQGIFVSENLFNNHLCSISSFNVKRKRFLLLRIGISKDEHYSFLFEKSVAGVYIISMKGEILDCNLAFAELLGYDDPNELIGTDVQELYAIPELRKKFLDRIDQEKSITNFEIQLLRKDGGRIWCSENSFVEDTGMGQTINGTITNITEKVVYEQAITESEERFRLLSQVTIESIAFVKNNEIIDCNDQLAKQFGYVKRSDIIGKTIGEFVNDDDLDRLREMITLQSFNKSEVRAKDRLDASLFLEGSGSQIKYQGEDTEVFLFYDITSRKRIEQALGQSIDRFKNLVENSPNGIYIVLNDRIRFANSAGTTLLGYPDEDELYNKTFMKFVHPSFKEAVENLLQETREGEDTNYIEVKVKNRSDEALDVGFKATLSVYEGKPSIQISLTNLSTRKQLLQEQIRAQLAEEINEALRREISGHKRTQEKLVEAQRFARSIIESSLDMIIAVNDDQRITEFNQAAQFQFGYTFQEAYGMRVAALFAGKKDFKKVVDALQNMGSFSGEIENLSKDGTPFTSLLSASLILNEEGKILGSMGVSRDITEVKKKEIELKESEERYRDLFDNANDFIMSFEGSGEFIYTNNAFRKTLGYSARELGKMTIYDLLKPGTFDKRKSLFKSFVGDSLEVTFISKDGGEISAHGDASVRKKDKKNHSIRAIFRDVSLARARELEAKEQRAKLESIFNSTENMMMWTVDRDMSITSFNSNFRRYLKSVHNQDVNLDDHCLTVLHGIRNKNIYQNQLEGFKKVFEGRPQEFELPLVNSHGEEVWLQVFINPVHLGEQFEEASALAYDITDRIVIDRRIRDSLKEKEVLLSEVHHRVKNNLQVISSILNLQSSFVTDERTLEILQESQNRIKSMSYIHETLYQTSDFSSIGFTEYINTLIRNLVQTYSMQSGHVNLELDLQEVIIPLDQAIPCGLIINELVSNAMKYAFDGIDDPRLQVSLNDDKGTVNIIVEDNGVGLPEGFRYEEADSLGIQLVYTLAEQLDGQVTVESDSGTRFLLTFDRIE